MVHYFIYAKDFSGSTQGNRHFHGSGMKSFNQFKSDVEEIQKELSASGKQPEESKIIYLHWGDRCFEVDEKACKQSYVKRESGHMGTEPDCIISYIQRHYNISKTNTIKLLYVITDGMIGRNSISKCFQLNQNMHYEKVVFHAFNTNLKSIDLSVAASFFKSRCRVYRNYKLFDDIDISSTFDYDKINVNNFETERDNLKSYIKLKFISKLKHDSVALQEVNNLKKLRYRLLSELSWKSQRIDVNLETKDRNVFLSEFVKTHWYRNLNAPTHDIKVDIEKSISTFINYIVSDKKSYSFNALKLETTFDKTVQEEPIVDVNFTPEQEIEFPDIILDDEKGIPVILLTELNLLDKIIFHTSKEADITDAVTPVSFNKFKSAMECPLFLLNDSDVSESIGYFYTLNVYKQLLTNTNKTEPRTRRPFHGGLVLVDTDEFDKYNDYILSATYFGSKKVHFNIGLFYYVLWKNCENKQWMDSNVVKQFKKYVMRRISTTKCNIGLSSLPLDPTEKTSLPTALWYCVELSSHIFKDDPQNFMHERLRMHYGVAHYMIEILKYFNYDLDFKFISDRKDLIRHVMVLKKIPTHTDKVYYLLQRIFKSVSGFLICEIEKPYNINKLNYLKFNHKEMLRDDVIAEEVHLNDFVHLMYLKDCKNTFEICEKTLRPFFTIGQNKSFYTELLKTIKKVVISYDDDHKKVKITYEVVDSLEFKKILSTYNLFIKCVEDSEKYPTITEYIEYILKKKKYHGDLVTIFPSNFYTDAESVYSQYENIMKTVDVKTFIEVSKKYVKRNERIKAEEIVKFKNEKEINEFISSEESKVKIKMSNNMTNTVQCSNCNIVIDEMLAYLQNCVSVVDEISLVRICSAKYSSTEIKKSKSMLFGCVSTDLRKITTKNRGTDQRDVADIINLLKSAEKDEIPVFVAKNLDRIPGLGMEHLDCAKLLRDLTGLQCAIDKVKASYATRVQINDSKGAIIPSPAPLPIAPPHSRPARTQSAWSAPLPITIITPSHSTPVQTRLVAPNQLSITDNERPLRPENDDDIVNKQEDEWPILSYRKKPVNKYR